ncbi:MAG: hypothetical protein FWE70_07270 [Oscillospiraceae bacterium]|nr:hypothetical protein [Oscillospiraceae bacterium]
MPGGNDKGNPPNTKVPGGNLIQEDDETYLEVDEDGVPYIVWTWDDEDGWTPRDYEPDEVEEIGELPPTGDPSALPGLFAMLGVSAAGLGVSFRGYRFGRKER